MDLSKLTQRFLWVVAWICQSCYMDLSQLFYVSLALCQTKPNWSLTKISKRVEASALNFKRCWMSQSIQCLGSVVCFWQCLLFLFWQYIFLQDIFSDGNVETRQSRVCCRWPSAIVAQSLHLNFPLDDNPALAYIVRKSRLDEARISYCWPKRIISTKKSISQSVHLNFPLYPSPCLFV